MAKQNLSVRIIQRFMTAGEYAELLGKYDSNKSVRSVTRVDYLSTPVSPEEEKALNDFLNDVPANQIGASLGLTSSTGVKVRVGNVALKVLYQKR